MLPAGESESAAQSVQASEPAAVLYLPVPHAAHGPPWGPVAPLLQLQSPAVSLPMGECELAGQIVQEDTPVAPTSVENFPAGQLMQGSVPVVLLYFPAWQSSHGPPSGPVAPAPHWDLSSVGEGVASSGQTGGVKDDPAPCAASEHKRYSQSVRSVPSWQYEVHSPSFAQ